MRLYVGVLILLFATPAFATLYLTQDAMGYMTLKGEMPASESDMFKKSYSSSPLNAFPAHELLGMRYFIFFGNGESHIVGPPGQISGWTPSTHSPLTHYAKQQLGSQGLPVFSTTDIGAIGPVVVYFCSFPLAGSTWDGWCMKTGTQSGGVVVGGAAQKQVTCSLNGDLQLRHYELTPERANTDLAYGTVFVNCNRSAKVTITLDKSIKLNGVEGLYSQLHVGYAAPGKPYTLTVGAGYTPIRLNSTLKSQGTVTSGAFSGSARLVMTFP